jgi:hypothetical protein
MKREIEKATHDVDDDHPAYSRLCTQFTQIDRHDGWTDRRSANKFVDFCASLLNLVTAATQSSPTSNAC